VLLQMKRGVASGLHFISFSSLSYERSKASSKASSPHSAIQSILFLMRVSSPFLKAGLYNDHKTKQCRRLQEAFWL
jgi:hypothetical protein